MKNPKKILLIPLLIVVSVLYWVTSSGQLSGMFGKKNTESLHITKWDNTYEGNNIQLYYMNHNNENIRSMGDNNNFGALKSEDENVEKDVENIIRWMNRNIEYKKNAVYESKEIYNVNFKKEGKILMNGDEITRVFEHIAAYLKIYAREAYIIRDVDQKGEEYVYRLNEYWNEKIGKWIVVDSINGVLFYKDDIPLSGLELFKERMENIRCESILGGKITGAYRKKISSFKYAFAINIDNNDYGKGIINAAVTYTEKEPFLMIQNAFYKPSIFVNEDDIFKKVPGRNEINDYNDEIPTMVFGKKKFKEEAKKTYLAVGVMLNSEMMDEYYYSFNGSDWIYSEGKFHFFCEMKNGVNKVKISLDGENALREIKFEYENSEAE